MTAAAGHGAAVRPFPVGRVGSPFGRLTLLTQPAVDVLDKTLLLFDQAISGREAAAKQKAGTAGGER